MKSQLLLALSLTLLVLPLAWTQPADEFFHQGARHYLVGTNIELARLAVTNGLQLYPNDPKLTNLWELLNRSQQQQQQNKDQDKQDQQNKDQQSKDQQKQEQQKQEQEKKDQQKQPDQQKPEDKQDQQSAKQDKKDDEKKEGQQAAESKDKPEDPNDPDAAPQGMASIRMTPQQAMQLLDTLRAEEKTMPFRPILKTNRHDRVFKDW